MKKLLLLFLPFFLLFACGQLENRIDTSSPVDTKLVYNILSEPDAQMRKQLYVKLNASEKIYIWKDRIDNFIANSNLNEQQKNHLALLKAKLNSELFNGDENTAKKLEREWGKTAFEIFDKEEIKGVLGSLRPLKNQISSNSTVSTSAADCGCNGDSWFDCSACNKSDPCSKDSDGCGFLLLYSCNQSCYLPPQNQP